MRRYHFISGLPRSGSTLLSAILKQNPRFTSNISDPLHSYVKNIIQITGASVGMEAAVNIDKRRNIMRGLFDLYYQNDREVCFNTNRAWSSDTALLKDLFPDFKMIVCLREVPWILDSFEILNNKNPHTIKPLYNHRDLGNVYDRCHMLMGNVPNAAGYVSMPLLNVKQSFHCSEVEHIFYVEYNHLVKHTDIVMKQIYDFLGEPFYQHDFKNVEDSYDEYDDQAKIDGLHKVRKEIKWIERRTILPVDLWKHYEPNSYWLYDFDNIKRNLNWSMQSKKVTLPTLNRQL